MLRTRAAAWPDTVAVSDGARRLTYAELWREADAIARWIASLQLARPAVAGVLMDNCADLVATVLGILSAGGVWLPLNPELPLSRTSEMVRDAGAELLFTHAARIGAANKLHWECPALRRLCCIDSEHGVDAIEPSPPQTTELWNLIGERATDAITGGGWLSSFTGQPFSAAEMDEYADNAYAKLAPLLHPDSRVLEIGCSTGLTLFRLAPLCAQYVGVDLSPVILERTRAEARARGLDNVTLVPLAADRLDELDASGFDLIVVNSVVQNFPGHNYLRAVLRAARAKLNGDGRIFLGDVMDLDARPALIAELSAFRDAHAGDAGVVTKLDWSSELFLSRSFIDGLAHELDGLAEVEHSDKRGTIRNELSAFRFDSLLRFAPGAARAGTVQRRVYGRADVAAAPHAEPPHAGGDDLAYLIYTSGTTGRPKGVAVGHAAIHNYVRWAAGYYFGAGGGDMALFTSPAFDLTLTSIFVPLYVGRVVRAFGPDDVDRQLARIFGPDGGCDTVKLTPSHITILGQLGLTRTPVSTAVVGGEEFTPEQLATLQRLNPAMAVYNEYGPTEATIGCTIARVDAPPIHIGVPIDNAEIWILDERDEPLPIGMAGELCIAGACLADGYWHDAEQTARRFTEHPFEPGARLYRTGDLARRQPDGTLALLGRSDHQVKIRGNRVELGEIEAKLRALPGVSDAIVVARADASGEAVLVAYVMAPRGLANVDARAELARELPAALVPSAFVVLAALPLTPSGKVDRARLPAPDRAARRGGEPARTAMERVVADVWSQVLGVTSIGRDEDFFALGGHSLKAVQVTLRLEARLGVAVTLRGLFARPVLKDFAAGLEGAVRSVQSHPVRLPDAPDYALSYGQRRLWILRQIESDPAVYTVSGAWRIDAALDVDALAAAFTALAARHEILRTEIVVRDGEPRQRILPSLGVPFAYEDLSAMPNADALARERIAARTSFELSEAPLWRAVLLRVAPERFVLVLHMHHIVSDGWSSEVFWRDLLALYRGDPLPPLAVQYRDYAAWQVGVLASADELRDYWHRTLAAPLPILALPADAPRPGTKSFDGATHVERFDPALLAAVKELAAACGVSMFSVLLAATAAVLHRWSGQNDIVLGTPVAGRQAVELEEQIGFYVNTLALRVAPEGKLAFGAFATSCGATVADALEHQAYPFDRLVEELAPERDPSRSPLFDVLVVLQNAERGLVDRGALDAAPIDVPVPVARFDLTVFFAEDAGGLSVALEYATSIFHAETAARFVRHLETLLRHACAAPATALADLDLLAPAERAALLAPPPPTPEPPSLLAQFSAQVAARPDRCAVADERYALSFAALDARSDALAAEIARSAPAESVVAVLADRSADNLVAFLAVLKAGCTYLALDPAYPHERLAVMCDAARVPVVVAQPPLAARARALAPRVVDLASLELAEPDAAARARENANVRGEAPVAYVVFTSGSSGAPKGVRGTARCLAQLIAWQRGELGDGLRSAQYAQLGFDVSVQELAFSACSGGTLHVVPEAGRRDPAVLRAQLAADDIELLTLPFTALAWLAQTQANLARLTALRHVITSGEALHLRGPLRRMLEERPDLTLHNQYGPSEAHVVTSHRISGPLHNLEPQPPIGRPIAGSYCRILDAAGRLCAAGVAGELFIGGRGLAAGYLADDALTAERFVPDPYRAGERLYRTGDLCRWRSDGTIDFLGRADDQLKVRGHRVEPAEIEAALVTYAGIDTAAVTALPGADGAAELVAFVTGPHLPTADELRQFLLGVLPAYLIPQRFVGVASLPLTASGKCDRGALAALPSQPLARAHAEPLAGATEHALAEIWCAVLGAASACASDDFFALGGHSLRALQLAAAVRERFGVDMPALAVFRRPTLRGQARWLDDFMLYGARHGGAVAQPLSAVAGRGVFAVPPLLGYGVVFHTLAQRMARPLLALDFPAEGDPVEQLCEIITTTQPGGAITLFGYSAGGNLGFEIAKRLESCGRRVDRLVLLDSFRLTATEPRARADLEAETENNLDYFAKTLQGDEQSRMFVDNPDIRALMAERVVAFLEWLNRSENAGQVDADIVLIESEQFADDPRRPAWRGATRGVCSMHAGAGPHTDMLFPPHFDVNAELVAALVGAS